METKKILKKLVAFSPCNSICATPKSIRGDRFTSQSVRNDHSRYTDLTVAEAAKIAGVGTQTVRSWLRRKNVKRARKVGPFTVDHESLLAYLRTGKRAE